MEVVHFSNEFPKEDLLDVFRHLHNRSKDHRHRLLAEFIDEATRAIKEETQKLPSQLRRKIPPFETLFTWAEDVGLRGGLLCGAVEGVLLVLVQISLYISHFEVHSNACRRSKGVHLTALGVGLLSAAAVSLAQESSDLPLHGAHAVRIAFRMGVHVQAVSHQLEARDVADEAATWAYVVHNVDPHDAQKELDTIHDAAPTANTCRIFISAVSRTSVTVSGPPSRLKRLFQRSKMFRDATTIALPVYGGLCHAPHVYGANDIRAIVHSGTLPRSPGPRSGGRQVGLLHSTSAGTLYAAGSELELFESVVAELLTQPIHWDKVVASVVNEAKDEAVTAITLSCLGNSIPLRELETALRMELADASIGLESYMASLYETVRTETIPRSTAQAKLAIVGMSCRLPGGAVNNERFWQLLESGLDVSRQIPADRFNIETHYDAEGKEMNKMMTKYGCFIDDPASFDAAFFNMSPREAMAVDPQMRLALVTAYEALEKAGFVSDRTLSTRLQRIGTFYGQAADDYREVNQGQEVGTYYIPGGCRAFGPGRINYFFKFAGPSYSIDTACSSGLAAIEVACQSLWKGEVDMAVAGGVNILTNPDGFTGLGKGHFLTRDHSACKTWDATADGYCRADGVGSLVIKRLEDAQAENDNILGVILATGTNHSAEAVSITHPHAGHQSYLARQILRQAGVNPLDVSYIELHGTGTQAGDYEEMKGVLDIYAPNSWPRRRVDQPLHIGSVKSNVGHGESVAGTTALIKVLLMLQKNAIPPHIGIKTEINPRLPTDLVKRNVHIPFTNTPWLQSCEKKRIAVVNNFGAAGGNTMMILEEAPFRMKSQIIDPRSSHIVAVSAKTKTALARNIRRLLEYLDESVTDINVADLGYTTTARRYQHSYRVAIASPNVDHLRKHLVHQLDVIDNLRPVGKDKTLPSIAFAFTGQGASHKSMNLELYRDVTTFREHLQQLDAIAQAQGFPSFIPALDGSHPKDYEHSPVVTQLALVCMEIALAQYWASLGVVPNVVLGHSLGEYAAMHVAGVISANDAIFLVGRRAELLQQKCEARSHSMVAVRASLPAITEAAAGRPHTVACINSPSDTVLSGTKAHMDDIASTLEAAGFRCIRLDVPFAFHSEQVDPILDDLEALCKSGIGIVFHEPKMPIISPLLGKVVFDGHTFKADYIRRATREAVDFVSALEEAYNVATIGDDTVWVEIGPHPVCTGFVKSTLPSTQVALPSIRRGDDNWKTVSDSTAALHLVGIELDWNQFHVPFASNLRLLDLPTYAWDEKSYWLQYNGNWCLTKGNTYYHDNHEATQSVARAAVVYESLTSLVQNIVSVEIEGLAGTVTMRSDLMQKDFLAAAHGHRMNDCGVVTSSIHADIAYTLGDYLYSRIYPDAKPPAMDIRNLVVTEGLVAQKGSMSTPQMIQVTASTSNIESQALELTWQNIARDGSVTEPFATAYVVFADSQEWLSSWSPMAHLIQHRIEMLEDLATQGQANRLSNNLAYTLFAKNLVDYAEKYRGMQSVVMRDLEAFAEVQLSSKDDGATFMVPPYFIDSVAHLAGFIMNCSDTMDTANYYSTTSGWKSMRFAEPLVAGSRYRSYVKMIPTKENSSQFLGDVYVLRADDHTIIGMVGGIHFRRFPRILLNRFFSAASVSDSAKPITPSKPSDSSGSDSGFDEPKLVNKAQIPEAPQRSAGHFDTETVIARQTPSLASSVTSNDSVGDSANTPSSTGGVADKALILIAQETGIELSQLQDSVGFADVGIDSLMSLVLTEKFKTTLDVKVNGSLFLDYPTIGDLRRWLDEYY